jgi:hypothetical protein
MWGIQLRLVDLSSKQVKKRAARAARCSLRASGFISYFWGYLCGMFESRTAIKKSTGKTKMAGKSFFLSLGFFVSIKGF